MERHRHRSRSRDRGRHRRSRSPRDRRSRSPPRRRSGRSNSGEERRYSCSSSRRSSFDHPSASGLRIMHSSRSSHGIASQSGSSHSATAPAIPGRCRSVECFEKIKTISEGTYGVVYKAKCKESGEVVALKRLKFDDRTRRNSGFPAYALREIQTLFLVDHPNVVNLKEIVIGRELSHLYMVMEFMEHELKSLMSAKTDFFSVSEVKCLLLQFLRGVHALHSKFIFHRDLKTSNLLLNANGILKIADMGLARHFSSPLQECTPTVVTLWYRAPELLLGTKKYSAAIDMWSVGCIFGELLCKRPVFEGPQGELEQISKIFELLGTPTEENWPGHKNLPYMQKFNFTKAPAGGLRRKFMKTGYISSTPLSETGFDLLSRLLTLDPTLRITAEAALRHPWFDEAPKPQDPEMISLTISHSYGEAHRDIVSLAQLGSGTYR